jgi:hypothetical protein
VYSSAADRVFQAETLVGFSGDPASYSSESVKPFFFKESGSDMTVESLLGVWHRRNSYSDYKKGR